MPTYSLHNKPTYSLHELTHNTMSLNASLAWRNDREIHSQFQWCANGGEDGHTLCVLLLDEQNNLYIGFLGLTLTIEDLQPDMNAFVSVEFVYLDPRVRGRDLSRSFIEHAIEKVAQWLQENARVLAGNTVTLYSASTPKSNAGERFIASLEEQLRPKASARGWSFTSSINDEG